MRKICFILFVMLVSCSANLLADDVQMYGVDNEEKGKGTRTEIPTPYVQADENTVEITCDSLVTNAEVTITDLNGTVMHHSSETLSRQHPRRRGAPLRSPRGRDLQPDAAGEHLLRVLPRGLACQDGVPRCRQHVRHRLHESSREEGARAHRGGGHVLRL